MSFRTLGSVMCVSLFALATVTHAQNAPQTAANSTSRWHKVRRSRGRPERLLKPLRAKSKSRRAARVRGAAVQRVGRPRPQEARGLQIPESTYKAQAEAALLGGLCPLPALSSTCVCPRDPPPVATAAKR